MLPEHLLTRNGKLTTQMPRTNAHPRTESMRPEVDLGKLAAVRRKWSGHPDETLICTWPGKLLFRRELAINLPRSVLFG